MVSLIIPDVKWKKAVFLNLETTFPLFHSQPSLSQSIIFLSSNPYRMITPHTGSVFKKTRREFQKRATDEWLKFVPRGKSKMKNEQSKDSRRNAKKRRCKRKTVQKMIKVLSAISQKKHHYEKRKCNIMSYMNAKIVLKRVIFWYPYILSFKPSFNYLPHIITLTKRPSRSERK